MRWLIFLFCGLQLFAGTFDDVVPSTSEEILSLTSDLLVDGFVSVSSGHIVISETDLLVKGAQDLSLKRTYIPPRILGRYDGRDKKDRFFLGHELHQLAAKGWVVHPHLEAGYNKHSPYFQVRDPQGFVLEFQIEGKEGILKTSSFGCSNLRGDRPSSSVDIRNTRLIVEGDWVKVICPDGLKRHYLKQFLGTYRLEKEILPNGKMIRYEYDARGLCQIVSSDPTGTLNYGSIKKNGDHYIGSDGREVNLIYENRQIKGTYKEDRLKARSSCHIPVMVRSVNPSYSNAVGYNERTLLDFYDAKKFPISCSYFQEKNEPVRVKTFSNPSGSFSFSYDPPIPDQKRGSTTVTHPNGAQTIYRFNSLLLLEAIENWWEDRLINQKTFSYDLKQHIKSIETLDGEGRLLIAKRFECDEAGNPTLEITEGDFGIFCIKRRFDQNRLVWEEHENGLSHVFTYLGDTRLITSKTTLYCPHSNCVNFCGHHNGPSSEDHQNLHNLSGSSIESGKILRQTLYTYDAANNLIQIDEEGKTKTIYTLYQQAPHLHRVEWEEKRTWEGQLIHKVRYGYDQWGNTHREDHFGSDGTLAYTIERTYNKKGELLIETNPLGERATYAYDERGRCNYEEPVSNHLTIHRTFDEKGRLTVLQENDHETQFTYNGSDELIKKVDYLGVQTTYHYHPVHGKPDRIEEGSSMTLIRYDAFGYPIETIDPMKAKTVKKFNGYGDVVQITHPEGGQELFSYYPNGQLQSHTHPDGLVTTYTYDALSRITQKNVGKRTSSFEYDGYHLRKTTDPAGFVTTYEYDLAGRKTEETREHQTIRYGYDALGFLAWEEKGSQRTCYRNDNLGRILTQSIDGLFNTAWTYDAGGNVATLQQDGLTQFFYDPHNRLVKKIDPQGNSTTISYERGSGILIEKRIDPEGVETINTYNHKGQLLTKWVGGQLVEEREYDGRFQLKRQDAIRFGITPNGNRQWMQEADFRRTDWTYTPGNLKCTHQKPDGTVLSYHYNEQLLPIQIGSRQFQYDPLDRLIRGTHFSRTLDPFGNITREEWSNGLWIETDYDEIDRPCIRRLPDHSRIEYEYEGPLLKKVSRFSPQGDLLYTHLYDDYDKMGNLRLETGSFQTAYEYDLLARRKSQKTPYFEESIEYSPSGNLIRKGNATFTYDSLSQMTSESNRFTAAYDPHYHLIHLNHETIEDPSYDENGNILKPGFVYDEFDQLIEINGEKIIYDALGRRIQKGNTSFLYIGDEEIGSFEKGVCKELKVLGKNAPIAIEIDQKPYAPIIDAQGAIRSLVDWHTHEVTFQNHCDAFGSDLSSEIPYAYLGKRYDPETGLVYFGKRYYDPSLRRWLTPDPMGPLDSTNLYQYVFNNPFRYHDPHGESIEGYLFGIGEVILGGAIVFGAFSCEALTLGGFTVVLGPTVGSGMALMGLGATTMAYHGQDLSFHSRSLSGYKFINTPSYSRDYHLEDLTFDWSYSSTKNSGKESSSLVNLKTSEPPYRGDELPLDGTKCPAPGFEWKGRGNPGSREGNWYNPATGESLRPDLDHKPPIRPHWDYCGPTAPKGARIYLDGTWEMKK